MVYPITITLEVIDGPDRGLVFSNLQPSITIGREEGNLVQLRDERVSRCHAKIQLDAGEVIISDLDSTNGTWVNGEPVRLAALKTGDRIMLGRTLLIVTIHGLPHETPADVPSTAYPTPLAAAASELLPPSEEGREGQEADFTVNHGMAGPTTMLPLPEGLTPGQAARLARIFHEIHAHMRDILWHATTSPSGRKIILNDQQWRQVIAATMQLASYYRMLVEPEPPTQPETPPSP
jgi:pSer/pThr/pTyr-binding forkhead associated (FHA) protein